MFLRQINPVHRHIGLAHKLYRMPCFSVLDGPGTAGDQWKRNQAMSNRRVIQLCRLIYWIWSQITVPSYWPVRYAPSEQMCCNGSHYASDTHAVVRTKWRRRALTAMLTRTRTGQAYYSLGTRYATHNQSLTSRTGRVTRKPRCRWQPAWCLRRCRAVSARVAQLLFCSSLFFIVGLIAKVYLHTKSEMCVYLYRFRS